VRTLGYEEVPDYPKFRAILIDINSGLNEFFRDIQSRLAHKVFVDKKEETIAEIKKQAAFSRLKKFKEDCVTLLAKKILKRYKEEVLQDQYFKMRAWRIKRIKEEKDAYEEEKKWVKEMIIKIKKER
jgi:hypothetical protein